MSDYTFAHDGPVNLVQDDNFEFAYYSRNERKFRRLREKLTQTWEQTAEEEIDPETFWMAVACIEIGGRYA